MQFLGNSSEIPGSLRRSLYVGFWRNVLGLWTDNMNAPRRRYVLNLPEWELPRLDDMEWVLIERLADTARKRRFRPETLEDAFHDVLHAGLMELTESAVNEVIDYWLQGLGDGNNGTSPELCIDLPYLEHDQVADPLALAYCVDNGDGTRTELNRTTLGAVVSRLLDDTDPSPGLSSRAKVVAFALRQLADRLEVQSRQMSRLPSGS